MSEYHKLHYAENRPYYLEKAKRNKARQRERLRKILRDAKDKPCHDCGCIYPFYVMQLDHVKGEKKFNVADAISTGMSDKRLLDEIEKCQVVCSNCHAERTHKRRLDTQRED